MLITEQHMILFTIALLWVLPWKGYALWTAGGRKDKAWFVFLLLPINTFGVLDIFYIFFVAKRKPQEIKELIVRTYRKAVRLLDMRSKKK